MFWWYVALVESVCAKRITLKPFELCITNVWKSFEYILEFRPFFLFLILPASYMQFALCVNFIFSLCSPDQLQTSYIGRLILELKSADGFQYFACLIISQVRGQATRTNPGPSSNEEAWPFGKIRRNYNQPIYHSSALVTCFG